MIFGAGAVPLRLPPYLCTLRNPQIAHPRTSHHISASTTFERSRVLAFSLLFLPFLAALLRQPTLHDGDSSVSVPTCVQINCCLSLCGALHNCSHVQ